MSSVTRFLRQVPVNTSYLVASDEADYYSFTADSANYVGNYTPGRFTSISPAIPANAVLRDMGKTIVSDGRSFRNVQLIVCSGAGVSAGAASYGSFGVRGGPSTPSAGAPYFSMYIETGAGGVGIPSPALFPILAPQL